MNHLVAILIALHLLAPIPAFAAERELTSYSLKHWGFILAMSLLGGFVSWYGQVRRGELKITSVSSLVGELCTSAFAGLLCFLLCEALGFPAMLTAAFTGISGHMGTRAISMFERHMEKRLGAHHPEDTPK